MWAKRKNACYVAPPESLVMEWFWGLLCLELKCMKSKLATTNKVDRLIFWQATQLYNPQQRFNFRNSLCWNRVEISWQPCIGTVTRDIDDVPNRTFYKPRSSSRTNINLTHTLSRAMRSAITIRVRMVHSIITLHREVKLYQSHYGNVPRPWTSHTQKTYQTESYVKKALKNISL